MTRRRTGFWGPAMLAIEAQQVMALRLAKLALGGDPGHLEARLMLSEKVAAAMDATGIVSAAMLRGERDGGAEEVVRMLRRKVRANRKRLLS